MVMDGRSTAFLTAIVVTVMVSSLCVVCPIPEESDSEFGELDYVALGDSITYGYEWGGGRVADPYPCLVSKRLGFGTHTNLAVSGTTLTECHGRSNIMSQLEEVRSGADVVSVMIGVNDYAISAPLGDIDDVGNDTIYGSLNLLVTGLKEGCPNAFIFFMTPYPFIGMPGHNSAGYTLADVADAVEEVCASHSVPVLDMYGDGGFILANDPRCDGLHPTQEFFRAYTAPQIIAFIEENFVPIIDL